MESEVKLHRSKSIKEYWKDAKARFRQIGSSQMAGQSDSLVSLIKDMTAQTDRLEENANSSAARRNAADTKSRRRYAPATIIRRLAQFAASLPALSMLLVCISSSIETKSKQERRAERYESAYVSALENGSPEAVALVLSNRLVKSDDITETDRLRYLKYLTDSGQPEKADRYMTSLTALPRIGSGELNLAMASVAKTSDRGAVDDDAEYESRLVRAIADPQSENMARALLGRFYREKGEFASAEWLLEPIRATELGCLELALLRNAQGQFSDVATTLAPYLARWRERWLSPKSASDIEIPAQAMILMNQEPLVLETLDRPAIDVPETTVKSLRRIAVDSLLQRDLRSGGLRLANAMQTIDDNFDRLPCDSVWVSPLIRLCAEDSPVRNAALKRRDALAFEKGCSADFLNALVHESRRAGDMAFARKLASFAVEKFPNDPESREIRALDLIEEDPSQADQAMAMIEPVIRDEPERLSAIAVRGRILEARGQDSEALEDYRNALPNDPWNPEKHRQIARLAKKLEKPDQARLHERLADELSASRTRVNIPQE